MIIFSSLVLIINLLFGLADDEVFDYEPMVYVKSSLQDPYTHQTESWQAIKELARDPTREKVARDAIADMTYSRAVSLLEEDRHIFLQLPKGIELNSTFAIPYPNILTMISSSLDIIVNYVGSETFSRLLKDLEFAGEIVIPKNLMHSTLLELLNKLPQYSYDQIGFVNELNTIGRTVFLVIGDLLGKVSSDGWNDVFLYLSLDNAMLTERQGIEVPLSDINLFVQSHLRYLKFIDAVPINKLPRMVRGNNYAFGWWLNCDGELPCLVNVLPRDAIISFSPAMRMYIIPSLGFGFVIANTAQISHNSRTFRDILNFDGEMFRRMLGVLQMQDDNENGHVKDNTETSDQSDKSANSGGAPSAPSSENTDNVEASALQSLLFEAKRYFLLYLELTSRQNILVRSLLWVLFLLVSHVLVYWAFHTTWWFWSLMIRSTHTRPKKE